MVQQHHGGDVHPGRARPIAGMRSMSRRSSREMAVLPTRDCRARLEGRSSSSRAWNGMDSAPDGRRTWRSAQGTRNLAYSALRGEFISSTDQVSRGPHGQNWRPPSSEYSIGYRRGPARPGWGGCPSGEAGVSGSSVGRSESGRSVGSAVARSEDGPSAGSSEPPQASSCGHRSSRKPSSSYRYSL